MLAMGEIGAIASKLILVAVFVIDLIAFLLALVAEDRRDTLIKPVNSNANFGKSCEYKEDYASTLAVGSFTFLLAAHLLIMCASNCLFYGRPLRSGSSKKLAIILFGICWVMFLSAEVFLVYGALKNANHTKNINYRIALTGLTGPIPCNTLKKGVFTAAAALIVVSGILLEVYFIAYRKAITPES